MDFNGCGPDDWAAVPGPPRQKIQEAKGEKQAPQIADHGASGRAKLFDGSHLYAMCRGGIAVMGDASHALGSWYQAKPVGACPFSDCAVFSFHPVKPITSGEGGVLVTNSEALARRARLFISHGIQRDPEQFNAPCADGWYYEQQSLGYNYRLSDIHTARWGCPR